ncbi:hypothetical protein [Amedibacillus sp. YH-ame6]
MSVFSVLCLLVGCSSTSIKLQKESFLVELGNPISVDAKTYLDKDSDKSLLKETTITFEVNGLYSVDKQKKILTSTTGEYLPVGKYHAKARHGKSEKEFVVEVKDTTAPKFIDFKDEISIEVGLEVTLEDYFKAEDLSQVTISINKDKLDLTKEGSYELQVTATDQYKNKETKKATIKVTGKEVVKEPTEENTNNNTTNNAGGTTQGNNAQAPSNGSNSNTGGSNTQAPSQQQQSTPNVCTPNGTYAPLGNSGRWFDSKNEADTWASNYIDGQSKPWRYFGWHAWTVEDSCGESRIDIWTIDFY